MEIDLMNIHEFSLTNQADMCRYSLAVPPTRVSTTPLVRCFDSGYKASDQWKGLWRYVWLWWAP